LSDALRRATGAALAAAALELVLARLSSGTQTRGDVLLSMLGWMLLAAAPVAAADRWLPAGRARRLVQALASTLPVAAVSAGVLASPLYERSGPVGWIVAGWVAAVLALRAVASQRGPATAAAPEAAGWTGLAALVAWTLDGAAPPPLSIVAGFVAVAAAVGAVALRWLHLPAVFLGAAVVSFAPPLPPAVVWPESEPGAPGPDVVLFTVAGLRRDSAEGRAFEWLAEHGSERTSARVDSLASLLSGRARPPGAGPAAPTLAERLAAVGYDTAAIVSSHGLEAEAGYARGYAAWQHAAERHAFALPRGPGAREARPLLPRLVTRAGGLGRPAPGGARHVARWVRELLEQRRIDRPFHLWVHWSDPVPPWLDADQIDIPRSLAVAIETGRVAPDDPAHAEALARVERHEVALVERGLRYAIEALGRVPTRGRILVVAGVPPTSDPAPWWVVGRPDAEPGVALPGPWAARELLPSLLALPELEGF